MFFSFFFSLYLLLLLLFPIEQLLLLLLLLPLLPLQLARSPASRRAAERATADSSNEEEARCMTKREREKNFLSV